MINVTKTYLPNKEKYKQYIDEIYASGWLTNNGPLVRKLEKRLALYLGVKNILLVSNGTVALEIAYRTLNIKGTAITTPFSFVATTNSLLTNGISPIFVDIKDDTLNIDSDKIVQALEKDTEVIVPVHVFGNCCDVEEIESIAEENNLKVVYDAAHAFNVRYKNESILNYGDISTLSFHATKLFHSVEGGALIINDDSLVEKARQLINFGIESTTSIPLLGTNAKMNEFEAAMGLCVLDEIEIINKKRQNIHELYEKKLSDYIQLQYKDLNATENYSYFPIILDSEISLKRVQNELSKRDIFPRRYFYPSLDTLEYIEPKQYCSISRDISLRILCLPIYPDLEEEEQLEIIEIIKGCL